MTPRRSPEGIHQARSGEPKWVIENQLAARPAHRRPMAREGEPLTANEWDTLQALAQIGPSALAVASALCVHLNTVKWRVQRIGQKYGMPKSEWRPWPVLREALRRGEVVASGDPEELLRGFLAYLHGQVPMGQLTPVWVGVETWVREQARRYLQERAGVAA